MVRADRARKKAAKEAKEAQGKEERGRPKATVEANKGQADKGKCSWKHRTKVLEAYSLDGVERDASQIQIPKDPILESRRAPEAQMW